MFRQLNTRKLSVLAMGASVVAAALEKVLGQIELQTAGSLPELTFWIPTALWGLVVLALTRAVCLLFIHRAPAVETETGNGH
jgi:anaerobic C4-dicarboxylate transporter